MLLACVHCSRPTIETAALPPGWHPDRLTALTPSDIKRLKADFAALGETRAVDYSHLGLCPECWAKLKPQPWQTPTPREKLLF